MRRWIVLLAMLTAAGTMTAEAQTQKQKWAAYRAANARTQQQKEAQARRAQQQAQQRAQKQRAQQQRAQAAKARLGTLAKAAGQRARDGARRTAKATRDATRKVVATVQKARELRRSYVDRQRRNEHHVRTMMGAIDKPYDPKFAKTVDKAVKRSQRDERHDTVRALAHAAKQRILQRFQKKENR